ncbi:hypothetical protein BH23CHL9_BH23CHL9_16200 [soil metagenome]
MAAPPYYPTYRDGAYTPGLTGRTIEVIVLVPFRRRERWAWLAAWALPIWAAVVPVFYLVAVVEPGQPPLPPMVPA